MTILLRYAPGSLRCLLICRLWAHTPDGLQRAIALSNPTRTSDGGWTKSTGSVPSVPVPIVLSRSRFLPTTPQVVYASPWPIQLAQADAAARSPQAWAQRLQSQLQASETIGMQWQALTNGWIQAAVSPEVIARWLMQMASGGQPDPGTAQSILPLPDLVGDADIALAESVSPLPLTSVDPLPRSPEPDSLRSVDAEMLWTLQYHHARCAQRLALARAVNITPQGWSVPAMVATPAASTAMSASFWSTLWRGDRQVVNQLITVVDHASTGWPRWQPGTSVTMSSAAGIDVVAPAPPNPKTMKQLLLAMVTLCHVWDQTCRDRPLLGVVSDDQGAVMARAHHLFLTQIGQRLLADFLQGDLGAIAPLDLS